MEGRGPADTLDVLVVVPESSDTAPGSTKPNEDPDGQPGGSDASDPTTDWSRDPDGAPGPTKTSLTSLSGVVADAGSYELVFPQVSGTGADFAVNGALQAVADRRYLGFAGDLAEMMGEEGGGDGVGALGGASVLQGEGSVVHDDGRLLGVVFLGTIEWAGAASVQVWVDTVMVDLASGLVVEPAAVFLPVVAEATETLLREQLGAETVWDEGFVPVVENFAHMVVTKAGLLVVFDHYQVAAGVAGAPEVVVPWTWPGLAEVVDPTGPAGVFVGGPSDPD